ncbi:MAG: nucleoside hydrolase [Pirellulales bacterium]|nr:nucleoside hydrolase [Pirellulales bacterium]
MARKVIIDCDPGIDGAVALAMALFDPRLDVVAVTATGGKVLPEQATVNVQAVIERLDPPKWPRMGVGSQPDMGLDADARHLHGPDGLAGESLAVAELHQRHPSEKVIADEVHAAPEELTILTLGPLTNVARALGRDPDVAGAIGQLVMTGGAVRASGDVSPAAEFNMYCDPHAARAVFRSATTKTLLPLDVTHQVAMSYDMMDHLPAESTRAGDFLRRIVAYAFRTHRNNLGLESIFLHGAVSLVSLTNPELFETEGLAGDVETRGELTTGETVFDRRSVPDARANMEVAHVVDVTAVKDAIYRGLAAAGDSR